MNYKIARELLLPDRLVKLQNTFVEEIPKKVHTMARPKFLAVMNELALCLDRDEKYLEVGTYQGGSLIGTLLGNNAHAIAVENFSEFSGTNSSETLRKNLTDFKVIKRVEIFEMDFRTYFKEYKVPSIGLYYYDGAHNTVSTYEGLELAFQYIVKNGIIILDDTIYKPVCIGVNQFIGKHFDELKIISAISPLAEFHPDWWQGTLFIQKLS
jgi:predicted O-methyltransferase YrrM